MASKLIDLTTGIVVEADEIKQVTEDMRTILDIDLADGVWLDIVAAYVGEAPRKWEGGTPVISDSKYRDRIKVKISLNTGFGGYDTIVDAVRRYVVMDETGTWGSVKNTPVTVREIGTNLYIEALGASSIGNARDKASQVKEYVAAGVGLYIVYLPDNPFTFDGSPIGLGFGSALDPNVGGSLAGIISFK